MDGRRVIQLLLSSCPRRWYCSRVRNPSLVDGAGVVLVVVVVVNVKEEEEVIVSSIKKLVPEDTSCTLPAPFLLLFGNNHLFLLLLLCQHDMPFRRWMDIVCGCIRPR